MGTYSHSGTRGGQTTLHQKRSTTSATKSARILRELAEDRETWTLRLDEALTLGDIEAQAKCEQAFAAIDEAEVLHRRIVEQAQQARASKRRAIERQIGVFVGLAEAAEREIDRAAYQNLIAQAKREKTSVL